MNPEKRTGFHGRGNWWGVGVPGQWGGMGKCAEGNMMEWKLSTLVFQAHKVQGEMWDGGCWRGTFRIKSLYLF